MNIRSAIVGAGRRMLESGLTLATWGNIGARDPETCLVYLTPSAMPYNDLTEDDIVVLNAGGDVIEGRRKPTSEAAMHLAIFSARADINAVIHTHAPRSSVFSCLNEPIPPITDEAAQVFGGSVPVSLYAKPGSAELAQNVVSVLGETGCACLMANHGAVCTGRDIPCAFTACLVLEATADIYRMARAIGSPLSLSPGEAAERRADAQAHYGQDKA